MQPTNLTIPAGFLGSGKTTWLRHRHADIVPRLDADNRPSLAFRPEKDVAIIPLVRSLFAQVPRLGRNQA